MSNPGFEKNHKLYELASEQGGFFTAKQAVSLGYVTNNHHLFVKKGVWKREQRGIYSVSFLTDQHPDHIYWEWYLWTQDRNGKPQGCFSYETALSIYELSDLNPSKIHITVPSTFRRGTKIPKVLRLHKANLKDSEIKTHLGYQVTTVLQTLLDIVIEERISEEFVEQAIREARDKGMITRQQLFDHPELARYLA